MKKLEFRTTEDNYVKMAWVGGGYVLLSEAVAEFNQAQDTIERLKNMLRELSPRCRTCDAIAAYSGTNYEGRITYACAEHVKLVKNVVMRPSELMQRVKEEVEGE